MSENKTERELFLEIYPLSQTHGYIKPGYLAAYEAFKKGRESAEEQLAEEIQSTQQWRELALQFDRHRLSAIVVIRGLLSKNVTPDEANVFIHAAPVQPHQITEENETLHKMAGWIARQRNLSDSEILSIIKNHPTMQRLIAAEGPDPMANWPLPTTG